jgi:ApeA N-terminal domain 1
MIDQFEIRGKWYTPERPRKKISGTLKFIPGEDIILEIDGIFEDSTDFDSSSKHTKSNLDIILGISPEGEEITLYKSHWRRSRGSSYMLIYVSAILVGKHFKRIEDIRFKELRLEFTNLNEWYARPGFKTPENVPPNQFAIHAVEPETVNLMSSDKYHVDIRSFSTVKDRRSEVQVTQKSQITVYLNAAENLDSCRSLIRKIQNFLALAMTEAPYPISIVALKGEQFTKRALPLNRPVKIYYRPTLPYARKEIYGPEMLFTLPDIRHEANALRNWLEKSETIEPVFTLYFAIQHSPFMYLETRFLYLAQAVETYHRTTYGGKYQDDDIYLNGLYAALVSSLPSDIDKGFRESLVKGKFRYAHEYSLRKRLTEMLKVLRDSLPDNVFRNSEHREQFVNKVVTTRNYLTHYDKGSMENVVKNAELFHLEQGLKLLMETIFLKEMGFDPNKAKECLKKSEAYDFIQAE